MSADTVNRPHIRFAKEYVGPVEQGYKTATVRHGPYHGIVSGDVCRAVTEDGDKFALLELEAIVQCDARDALEAIEQHGAEHGAQSTEQLVARLNRHYDAEIGEESRVHAIVFHVAEDGDQA